MGLMIPVGEDIAFDSIAELAAVAAAFGAERLDVEVEAEEQVVLELLGLEPNGVWDLGFRAPLSALEAVLAYAREPLAGYLDVRHPRGDLRLWQDHWWVDGLPAPPERAGQARQRGEVWDLVATSREAALDCWRNAAPEAGELWARATGVTRRGLAGLLAAAAGAPVQLGLALPREQARAQAERRPELPWRWAAGDLQLDVAARRARVFQLAPVAPEAGARIAATLEGCRARR